MSTSSAVLATDSLNPTSERCTICREFVVSLEQIYESPEIDGGLDDDDSKVRWSFRDVPPFFPRLATSARAGCQWCSFLDRIVTQGMRLKDPSWREFPGEMGDSVDAEETVVLDFKPLRFFTSSPGLLKGLRRCIREDGPDGPIIEFDVINSADFDFPSVDNIKAIRHQINECVHHHQACPGFTKAGSPLRLLDVLQGDLIKLEEMGGIESTYAALSYCWGGSTALQALRTVSTNVEQRLRGFLLSELPETIRDAILVTRSLGIRYIWIDAFCIVQDSSTEWPSEASKMMQYYGKAYVTIVPALSQSADSGMGFGRTNIFCSSFPGPWTNRSGRELVLSSVPQIDLLRKSKWNSRGWTYQESLNSCRTLFFIGHEVNLMCRSGHWYSQSGWHPFNSYSYSYFLPLNNSTTLVDDSNLDDTWYAAIDEFTHRSLENRQDQWFAFSGIAERFSELCNWEVILGLRKHNIILELVYWVPHQVDISLAEPHIASWTWVNAHWPPSGDGVCEILRHASKAIPEGLLLKPHAYLEAVISNSDNARSTKLQIRGGILQHDQLEPFLAHQVQNRDVFESPGREPGMARFDHTYGPKYRCACNPKHETTDCEAYNTLSSAPIAPISALLLGLTDPYEDNPSNPIFVESLLLWHFLLIQPTSSKVLSKNELPKFRRVGTLFALGRHFDTYDIDLRSQLGSHTQSIVLA